MKINKAIFKMEFYISRHEPIAVAEENATKAKSRGAVLSAFGVA